MKSYPRMYVYEHITATMAKGTEPHLEKEGSAMLDRLAFTLHQGQHAPVVVFLHESRRDLLPNLDVHDVRGGARFEELIETADPHGLWHVVAPETDGILLSLLRQLHERGREWWGPSLDLVELFTDKLESYRKIGAPLVETADDPATLTGGPEFVVVKPRDGCGSMYVARSPRDRIGELVEKIRAEGCAGDLVYQPWIEGQATSMAVIGSGSDGPLSYLPMAEQTVVRIPEGPFERLSYRGGRIPSPVSSKIALEAVRAVVEQLPKFTGYLGYDLVINSQGEAVIIEVNPRLSTSYAGYSRLFGARKMGQILMGGPLSPSVMGKPVRFTADGVYEYEG